MSGAQDLLAILRGDSAPQSSSSSSKSVYHTPLPSSSPAQGTASNGAQKDKDGLGVLYAAFGRPHPSSQAQPAPPPHPTLASLSSQQPAQLHQGTPPDTRMPSTPCQPDSRALLSLLQGMSSPPLASSSTVPAPAPPLPESAKAPISPTSFLKAGGNAGDLLKGFMGGSSFGGTPSGGAGSSSSALANGANAGSSTHQAQHTPTKAAQPPPEQKNAPSPGQPNFTFVSPFAVLDQALAADRASASSSPQANRTNAREQEIGPLSSLPAHLRPQPPPSSASHTLSSPLSNEGREPETKHSVHAAVEEALSPSSSHPASPTTALSPSYSAANGAPHPSSSSSQGPFSSAYLASQYLTPSLPTFSSQIPTLSLPSWAPSGLRLPRSSYPLSAPQTLSITLAPPHLESLAPSLPSTTPITLMEVGTTYEGGGRTRLAAAWEGGLGYATKGAKIRVIERESGGRALLKPAKGEKDKKDKGERIVDLRVAPSVSVEVGEERRHLVSVSSGGGLTLWSVSERFGGEDGAKTTYSRLLDLTFPPSSAPSLSRFHPFYPSSGSQVIALVRQDGSAWLLDVEKALEASNGDEKKEDGEEVLRKFGTKIEADQPILDLTFSTDGSVFSLLTYSSQTGALYSVRSTSAISTVLFSGAIPLPPSANLSPASSTSTSTSATATPSPAPSKPLADGTRGETEDAELEERAKPEPNELVFLSDQTSSRPSALAVSFTHGTEVVVFPLRRRPCSGPAEEDLPAAAVTSLGFPLPSANDVQEGQHYSHLSYHHATQSLLCSSTLRGSIWSFRLSFPPVPVAPPASDADALNDADYLSTLLSHLPASTASPIRIEHVLETPLSSGPAVSFTLDPSPSLPSAEENGAAPIPTTVQATGKTNFNVLVSHSGGIDLVQLAAEKPREYRRSVSGASTGAALPSPMDAPVALGDFPEHAHGEREPGEEDEAEEHGHTDEDEADEFARAMAAGRRMSLEGSIYVSSEVEVHVDGPEVEDEELAVLRLRPEDVVDREREDSGYAHGGVNGWREQQEREREDEAEREPETPVVRQFSTSILEQEQELQDEPALGDLGASGLPVTPNVEVDAPLSVIPSSSSSTSAFLHQSQTATQSPPPRSIGAGDVDIVRELRRMEQAFSVEISKVVKAELEKHVHHLEEERLSSLSAQTTREETLLKLALQAVKKDTTKLVESAVREQVKNQIGPAVVGAIKQVLPGELDKQLSRPDVGFPLAASIATTIAPPLERSLTDALLSRVVPSVEAHIYKAVDNVINIIRDEMLEVRKEITREQAGAVTVLEDEVGALRSEVGGLKAQLERVEQILLAQASVRADKPSTSPRIQQHASTTLPPHAVPQQHPHPQRQVPAGAATGNVFQSPPHARTAAAPATTTSLPPIPRTSTPPARYEELFTEAMQPQHEPEFTALVHLINSSPASRLEAVFPASPAEPPKISMAVVLSLAYRLSQVIAQREGVMDEEGRKMLSWLRRAVSACDGKQSPEFQARIPLILSTVCENLVSRGRHLMALGDAKGAGDIRIVEQYARARLSLFHQGAGGEGVEGFRRRG
ncbi:hypothetical protein JCM8547_001697 [Rhodosporidiobolus lusitaniae]